VRYVPSEGLAGGVEHPLERGSLALEAPVQGPGAHRELAGNRTHRAVAGGE